MFIFFFFLNNQLFGYIRPLYFGWDRLEPNWTETTIWTFNPLVPVEVQYIEKNPGMLSSWMTWGWVNYQGILILKCTSPLTTVTGSIESFWMNLFVFHWTNSSKVLHITWVNHLINFSRGTSSVFANAVWVAYIRVNEIWNGYEIWNLYNTFIRINWFILQTICIQNYYVNCQWK